MKTINKLRNRKAVSPVIATVILVAVTISVAIGVTYWMSGISAQYTSFEKIEVQSGYATLTPGVQWTITLDLKNSGSAPSTITQIFVNEVPITVFGSSGVLTTPFETIETGMLGTGLTIESGDTLPINVYIGIAYGKLSSGTTVNIKLHSAGGMDYIKLVKLT